MLNVVSRSEGLKGKLSEEEAIIRAGLGKFNKTVSAEPVAENKISLGWIRGEKGKGCRYKKGKYYN